MPIPVHAVGLGMVLGFIFLEITGLSAGGLIVPGYLAYSWGDPYRIISTFVVAFACYSTVLLLSNFMIIYSYRRFMVAVLTSYLLSYLISNYILFQVPVALDIRVIGYIVPGLIANTMIKQGLIKTILATLLISGVTRLLLLLII